MVGPEAPPQSVQMLLFFHATALLSSGAQGNFSFGSYLAYAIWQISRRPGLCRLTAIWIIGSDIGGSTKIHGSI